MEFYLAITLPHEQVKCCLEPAINSALVTTLIESGIIIIARSTLLSFALTKAFSCTLAACNDAKAEPWHLQCIDIFVDSYMLSKIKQVNLLSQPDIIAIYAASCV